MITKRTYGRVTWIDIFEPSPEEVREVIETYHINPIVSKDMLLPSPKSQIYDYRDLVYLTLHFPVRKNRQSEVAPQEVDILLSKHFIATIHYEPVDALEQFGKSFEVTSILGNQDIPHAGFLFFEIIRQLYENVRNEVSAIEDELSEIEPKVFHGKEKEAVKELSDLNRVLLQYKQIIGPSHELLELAATYAEYLFGKDFEKVSHTLLAEYAKTSKEIQYRKEWLDELWNTNNTLLTTKQNEIMKNLTMVSFVVFPLSLIVSVFDLYTNLAGVETGTKAFWLLLAVLIVSVIGVFFFFKNKKWI